MTQDEIIRIAQKAGIGEFESDEDWFDVSLYDLKAFASLVAAHEREKQADISALPIIIEVAVKEAVIAEREACAKVCEDINNPTFEAVAAAIRARTT